MMNVKRHAPLGHYCKIVIGSPPVIPGPGPRSIDTSGSHDKQVHSNTCTLCVHTCIYIYMRARSSMVVWTF